MPFQSMAQNAWAHTKDGMKALGKKTVREWEKATKYKGLPDHVTKKKKGIIRKMMQKHK